MGTSTPEQAGSRQGPDSFSFQSCILEYVIAGPSPPQAPKVKSIVVENAIPLAPASIWWTNLATLLPLEVSFPWIMSIIIFKIHHNLSGAISFMPVPARNFVVLYSLVMVLKIYCDDLSMEVL